MEQRRKIAVFDLDGTYYSGPSLRHYFMFAARTLMRRGWVGLALKILGRFAAWKFLHISSHIDMKYANCRDIEAALGPEDTACFVVGMKGKVHPGVAALRARLKHRGYITVLSTASPRSYCEPFALGEGFDFCMATETTSSRELYRENRGQAKTERLKAIDGDLCVVVTDHHDDLPLLLANTEGTNYLVAPSQATVDKLHVHLPSEPILIP